MKKINYNQTDFEYPTLSKLIFFLLLLCTVCQPFSVAANTKLETTMIENFWIERDVTDAGVFYNYFTTRPKSKDVYHLISHGRPGELLLNGEWKDAKEIADFLNDKIGNRSQLVIYGCEFGKGEKGKTALAYLEDNLKVTISASDNMTGKDGDWKFEIGSFNTKAFADYPHNLQLDTSKRFVVQE